MKQKITSALIVALLGGAVALWGCEKVAPAELSPTAGPANQRLAAPGTPGQTGKLTPAQLAWTRFVDKVERGEQADPTGQYVSKATVCAEKPASERARRPKFDQAAGVPAGLVIRASGAVALPTGHSREADPDDPPVVCPMGCPGTGGGTGVTSTFTTSQNQGGSGQIHDLKLVGSGSSTSRAEALNSGYTLLDADLNKGAGGAYVYFCFVRDAANVLSGLEYYQGQPNSAPLDVLTSFATKKGTPTKPRADARYFDIWSPNQNPYPYWGYVDLNAGASGDYIYSFQSKSNQVQPFTGYVSEVGILSGNSAGITPPAGWVKYPQDLNEGAGGDFIYFCYKY